MLLAIRFPSQLTDYVTQSVGPLASGARKFPASPRSFGFEREGASYVDLPALGIFGHKLEPASDI
jgi:hypothetical protein